MDYKEFEVFITGAVQKKVGADYDVRIQQVRKNNGVVLDGLLIMAKDKIISPTIYLEPYYQGYSKGIDPDKIVADILTFYENNRDTIPKCVEDLKDFESIKNKVVYKLIRQAGNEELLEDIPYTAFLDLALVYYIILDTDDVGQATVLIHRRHLKMWDVDFKELCRLAVENTERLLPVQIRPIMDIMYEMVAENVRDEDDRKSICEELEHDKRSEADSLFVMSNATGINGAACMAYKSAVEDFAQECDSDIFILPSSTHEILLLKFSEELILADLKAMVRNVNESVLDELDVLSDHVYIFRREDRKVHIAI